MSVNFQNESPPVAENTASHCSTGPSVVDRPEAECTRSSIAFISSH